MSTSTASPLDLELKLADEAVKKLEKKLPWYKRLNRKYLTGSAFVAWQVSSLFTWVKAGFTAVLLFGKSNLALALATKYPLMYSVGTTAWNKLCVVVIAAIAVFKEAI